MTSASRPIRFSSTADEMPAWPPPTTRTSGSRSSKAISVCRSSNQSRAAKSRACETGALRLDRSSQILLKSSDVEIVQATGEACTGHTSLTVPMPGPLIVSKEMIASMTSRPATTALRGASAVVFTRKPVARTSEARRLSSWQSVSLPLDVASCQEIPNRFRQWLSGRNSSAKALSSPLVSARPKACTHCFTVSSAEGPSLSNIDALPRFIGNLFMRVSDRSRGPSSTGNAAARRVFVIQQANVRPSSVRQAADEIDDRGADLAGALLLGPVAAAGEHLDVTQCGDELLEVGEMLGRAGGGDHQVAVARDIECRDGHLYVCESSRQLPVAVDVAIIIEAAAEA